MINTFYCSHCDEGRTPDEIIMPYPDVWLCDICENEVDHVAPGEDPTAPDTLTEKWL